MVYGQPMLDTEAFTRLFKVNGYDRWRTRVDGIPEVMGTSPLATLPPTLWLERDGMPIFSQMHAGVPYAQWAPATVAPRGDARDG